MPLSPGTRLGSYEILTPLGVGGMGEVYRARDSKLDRDVALKILPESFASDPERLARFEREAKTLAALNHPHISNGKMNGGEREGYRRHAPGDFDHAAVRLPPAGGIPTVVLRRDARWPVPDDDADGRRAAVTLTLTVNWPQLRQSNR
jgi:hypothetical protein